VREGAAVGGDDAVAQARLACIVADAVDEDAVLVTALEADFFGDVALVLQTAPSQSSGPSHRPCPRRRTWSRNAQRRGSARPDTAFLVGEGALSVGVEDAPTVVGAARAAVVTATLSLRVVLSA
jgi:hypothetical protein